LVDIALLWMLWPLVAHGKTIRLAWRDTPRGKIAAMVLLSLAPVLLVVTIATFPGEALDKVPSAPFIPWKDRIGWSLKSPHELLVGGEIDLRARGLTSLWSNRLVVPGIDVTGHAKFSGETKIATPLETVTLRARHLEGAVLIGANFRNADFSAANLAGAWLVGADLRGAKLGCLTRNPEETVGVFSGLAELATKDCTELQEAWLDDANLQGLELNDAHLQGASLKRAKLQGASLDEAQLQYVVLERAQLQGASLNRANLQFARLAHARFQGEMLDDAQMQGASLEGAQLQGASLNGTQLQGANLFSGQLPSFAQVVVWRADPRKANLEGAFIVAPETGMKEECHDKRAVCNWSVVSFTELERLVKEQVPEGKLRQNALERIAARLDPTKSLMGEGEIAAAWINLINFDYTNPLPGLPNSVVEEWRKISCADDGQAPYVARGLLWRLVKFLQPRGPDSEQKHDLATALLDEKNCSGARGLSSSEKALLRKLRAESPVPNF
jgi:uncharacterized protein YjbI with pentapeptide repeats